MLLDLKLFRLDLTMKNTRAQLIALKTFLEDKRVDGVISMMSPEKRNLALKSVKQELSIYERQIQNISKLAMQIKQVYLRVGLFDSVYMHEEELRSELVNALDQESEWLVKQSRLSVARLSSLEQAHKIIDDFQIAQCNW